MPPSNRDLAEWEDKVEFINVTKEIVIRGSLPKVKVVTTITRDLTLTPDQIERIVVEWFRLEGQLAPNVEIKCQYVDADADPYTGVRPFMRLGTQHKVEEEVGGGKG